MILLGVYCQRNMLCLHKERVYFGLCHQGRPISPHLRRDLVSVSHVLGPVPTGVGKLRTEGSTGRLYIDRPPASLVRLLRRLDFPTGMTRKRKATGLKSVYRYGLFSDNLLSVLTVLRPRGPNSNSSKVPRGPSVLRPSLCVPLVEQSVRLGWTVGVGVVSTVLSGG